jgi:hypothetical protein
MITLSKPFGHSSKNRGELPTAGCGALNPRFYFVHASTKPRFLTKMMHLKSGIPGSGWMRRQLAAKFGRISHGLWQRYPHFDAISPGLDRYCSKNSSWANVSDHVTLLNPAHGSASEVRARISGLDPRLQGR